PPCDAGCQQQSSLVAPSRAMTEHTLDAVRRGPIPPIGISPERGKKTTRRLLFIVGTKPQTVGQALLSCQIGRPGSVSSFAPRIDTCPRTYRGVASQRRATARDRA